MTPFIAEIMGTFLLILLGCGVNANVSLKKTYGSDSGWIVITTGWAFAVYTGVVVAGPYSGAHLNPAVTIGLAIAGEFSIYDVPNYILAQFIGAMLGAFFVWLMNKDHFDATEDGNSKRGVFCNSPAIPNVFLNILTEILGTFVLVFAVLYFTDAVSMKDNTIIGLGSLGALPVAIIVWGIGLCLGGTTGYAINPARDLGPRIIHALVPIKNKGSNGWRYSWIPVVGPILGATLAAGIAMVLQ
ncbi:aquaporin family protein [Flagellimonas sp. HMM57]|uniref:MIP/aquaporin family protein n=1 Tax=unclassified Flagellimonas TaxID=2644544 RepID=UPI0013D0EA82|nr:MULTISPECIES: MIP/aquaporin family protein [unclassified Flagellimonas]UII74631.1 aquaporin family protein [Flagellimonas sp. HMM57]